MSSRQIVQIDVITHANLISKKPEPHQKHYKIFKYLDELPGFSEAHAILKEQMKIETVDPFSEQQEVPEEDKKPAAKRAKKRRASEPKGKGKTKKSKQK